MKRRNIKLLCIQETMWKGEKVRELGDGYKLFYYGVNAKRNGVGIVLSPELKIRELEVIRESDRIIWMSLR